MRRQGTENLHINWQETVTVFRTRSSHVARCFYPSHIPKNLLACTSQHACEADTPWQGGETCTERPVLQEGQGEPSQDINRYSTGWTAALNSRLLQVYLLTFQVWVQAEGYLARSAFKLQELQQKHKLISPGTVHADMVCACSTT